MAGQPWTLQSSMIANYSAFTPYVVVAVDYSGLVSHPRTRQDGAGVHMMWDESFQGGTVRVV